MEEAWRRDWILAQALLKVIWLFLVVEYKQAEAGVDFLFRFFLSLFFLFPFSSYHPIIGMAASVHCDWGTQGLVG